MTVSNAASASNVLDGTSLRYWEDIRVDETTRTRERAITTQEIIEFAAKYDPQYFHTDAQAAKQSIFGGLVGSGIHTLALWRRMDLEVNGNIAFACGIAWENVKWKQPLWPDDVIYATSRCIGKRESAKRSDVGLVTLHHEVINQKGEVVIAFDSIALVYRKAGAE